MTGISELTPAFKEFRHELMNKLTVAKSCFYLIDDKDTSLAQIQNQVTLGIKSIEHIEQLFHELDK